MRSQVAASWLVAEVAHGHAQPLRGEQGANLTLESAYGMQLNRLVDAS